MLRLSEIAGSNILVQVIHVTWDKSGRGGRAAEKRNQIPSAMPLPRELLPSIGRHLLIHESHWGHTNEFASEITSKIWTTTAANEFRFRCTTVRPNGSGAELEWTWNDWGIPPRRIWNSDGNTVPATHKSIVHECEWACARWNARFTCIDTGNWWYEAVTINVGVHPDPAIPFDFFTARAPVDDYSQVAYLR